MNDRPAPERLPWLWGLILVVATVLAYQPAWNAGFIWDDDYYVTNNPLITAPDGLKRIWFSTDSPSQYFPLTYTAFRIQHSLWGMEAAGYHWVNILLHAVNALVLWRLLKRLSVPGAWLAAAIFALHPVHVESVAWITELKNVLSLFFFLLSLRAWVEFTEGNVRSWNYAFALIFYLLALLSKTTACTLPAALLLVLWLRRQPITLKRLAQVLPFVVVGLAMGLLTIWWERHHQNTVGAEFQIAPLERLLLASRAFWFYLGKLLWPMGLAFSYPRWTMNPAELRSYAWLLAALALGGGIWFARRFTGRSVETALLFFAAMLSPLLGFIMLYTFRYASVADHYQYVASIGPIALFGAGLTLGLARLRRSASLPTAISAILLLALATLTWRQSRIYENPETLWRATIAANPAASLAYNNLGTELNRKGARDEAEGCYRKALELTPDWAEAHVNLANVLRARNLVDEAIHHYRVAISNEPGLPEAHYNLGVALMHRGAGAEAMACFERAVQLKPGFALAHLGLGDAALHRGDFDRAIAHYERMLLLDPASFPARINLGTAFLKKGQFQDALEQYERALDLNPEFAGAHNNLRDLAWALATHPDASVRNGPKAVVVAEHAFRISRGNDPYVVGTLAAAYAEAGRFNEAVATAGKALAVAQAQSNTNLVNSLEAAIRSFREAKPLRQ